MNRSIEKKLLVWKDSPRRKPLILRGARQVGKSWILNEFGRKYFKHVVVCNLDKDEEIRSILVQVNQALEEKGYNPISQIVGYIMSGDPTYITSHNNARSLIMKVERDELVEELLKQYIRSNSWDK